MKWMSSSQASGTTETKGRKCYCGQFHILKSNSSIYSSGHYTREKEKGLDKIEKVRSLGQQKNGTENYHGCVSLSLKTKPEE